MEQVLYAKGLVALTVFAISTLFIQQIPTEPIPASIQIVATSSPAVILNTKADCSKYEKIIKQYDWDDDIAMEICKHESEGDASAIGDKDTAYVSCGLMQIRTIAGRPSCDELKDPEKNIAYAYKLWKEKGWVHWRTTCNTKTNCDK